MVPKKVSGARNLGTLLVKLVYEPSSLQAVGFEHGELARNALNESSLGVPARVIIGIVDGPVGLASFEALAS
jgi:hypothetical protein